MHADSPPRVRHHCLKDQGRDILAVGDIDLPSGTTAPLYGSGDLATLGLSETPPPRCPRVYISSRHAALVSLVFVFMYVFGRVTLSLLVYVLRCVVGRLLVSVFYARRFSLRLLRCAAAGSSVTYDFCCIFCYAFSCLPLRLLGTVGASVKYAVNERRCSPRVATTESA